MQRLDRHRADRRTASSKRSIGLIDPEEWAGAVADVSAVSGEGEFERWTIAYEAVYERARKRDSSPETVVSRPSGSRSARPIEAPPASPPESSPGRSARCCGRATIPRRRADAGRACTGRGLSISSRRRRRSSSSSSTWRNRPASASSFPDAISTTSRPVFARVDLVGRAPRGPAGSAVRVREGTCRRQGGARNPGAIAKASTPLPRVRLLATRSGASGPPWRSRRRWRTASVGRSVGGHVHDPPKAAAPHSRQDGARAEERALQLTATSFHHTSGSASSSGPTAAAAAALFTSSVGGRAGARFRLAAPRRRRDR